MAKAGWWPCPFGVSTWRNSASDFWSTGLSDCDDVAAGRLSNSSCQGMKDGEWISPRICDTYNILCGCLLKIVTNSANNTNPNQKHVISPTKNIFFPPGLLPFLRQSYSRLADCHHLEYDLCFMTTHLRQFPLTGKPIISFLLLIPFFPKGISFRLLWWTNNI